MKKIFIYVCVLFISISFNSCSDSFLELTPTDKISGEDFYKTKEDIFQALVAAYDPLSWDNWSFGQYSPIQVVSDVMSDDIYVGGANAADLLSWHQMAAFKAKPTETPSSLWIISYSGINRANLVIANIPYIKDIDDASKKQYLAEAFYLRAYYYHTLWKFWGNVPYYAENPGPPNYTAPQLKSDEIYAHIIEDLDSALAGNYLPEIVDISNKGRATADAARMLRSTVVMYQNDDSRYPACLTDMKTIINSGRYSLEPNFEKIFMDEGEWGTGSIWEVNLWDNTNNDWSNPIMSQGTVLPILIGINGLSGSSTYVGGWGFGPVVADLYNSYNTNDQRKDAGILSFDKLMVDEPGVSYVPRYQDTRFFNKKYIARKGYSTSAGISELNYKNNTRIYRYSEALLNASELLLRTGGAIGDAQMYYDKVRQRAFGANFSAKTVSLDNLLQERRYEFALEGHRFWDLVRFGKAVQVLGSKGYTDNKKYLPIPQSEIDKSNGVLVQNPY